MKDTRKKERDLSSQRCKEPTSQKVKGIPAVAGFWVRVKV